MRRGFRTNARRGSTNPPAPNADGQGVGTGGGPRRLDLREALPKARAFTLRDSNSDNNNHNGKITAVRSPTEASPGSGLKGPRAVQFLPDERTSSPVGGGGAQRTPAGHNDALAAADTSSIGGGFEGSPPSMGGRSTKSQEYTGVGTDITLAEEYFAYYTGEAQYICECFVRECNRHWRHAVRDLGNKAPLRFGHNEAIQKANSLSAGETRNILLGHSARVVDGWMGAIKGLRDRALQIVHKCLESAYCPRVQGEGSSIVSVGVEDAESFVDLEEMAYVHVWKSRREGRAFQHSLRALAQMRQDVLLPPIVATPFSVAVAFQARFITVTWMPPLVHSKPQSLEGGILAQVEEVWRRAVGVDQPGVSVPLYAGGDGRYYSITMAILAESNLTLTPESTLHERFEYNCRDDLVEFVRTGEGATNLAHTKNGIEDRLLPALQRKMKDIKVLLNSPPHFISHLFHSCGVNLQLLLHVRDRFAMQINERKDQLVSLLTIGDFSRAKAFILESIDNEVVARTLKALILGAVAHATRSYVPYSREDMSDIILRSANTTIQGFLRSAKFIKCIMLPAIQKKFIKAPDFVLDMDKVHIIKIFKHLEERLGLTFDVQEKRFVKSDVRPMFLGCSGRKPIPYCPLNDASVVALEFLTAQKAWRRSQPMVQRMLATLMAVSVSATGINLSIDGCFTIFTEALCDVLSRHEREQKKFLSGGGGASSSVVAGGSVTPGTTRGGGVVIHTPFSSSVAASQFTEGGIAPHLLLIGIMGEIVQSESPAVTTSELEYLCRIRVLEFADKMFIAERCQQLFQFFSSPKGMITVRLDDTDTRVKVLSLWGRAIMRGIENVAHQPEVDRQLDPKKMYERVLGKYPLPTATNLETFLQLITDEDLMQAISRATPEVRSNIIRAFVAASIVVKNSTSERCARVIISFADAIYDDIFEELHPTLADSLCALHDELPRGSAMAFNIALIVAPSLMHHPGSARLAMDVGALIRQLKMAKRMLLPDEIDIFHVVSQGKVLYQTVINVAEGRERAEDEALYKQVLDEEHSSTTKPAPPMAEDDDEAGCNDDDAGSDGVPDSEVYSVTTQVLIASRPPGHFLISKWLGEFLERPECMEMLERYRIELMCQQHAHILKEVIRRAILIDQREKEVLQIREMRARLLLERELYAQYLLQSDRFLRYIVVQLYESRFRCVLHEFHDRTMYRLTRHQEFQQLILVILNVVCRQKIAERVLRQEAEARLRREGKYLLSLLDVVEDYHRQLTAHWESDQRRATLLPRHGQTLLLDDFGWRYTRQTEWLLTITLMKHQERSHRIERDAIGIIIEQQEATARWTRQQLLQREHLSSMESLERWVTFQAQHAEAFALREFAVRMDIVRREDAETRASLHLAWSDLRRYEIQEVTQHLVDNVVPFYKQQHRLFVHQWWDIYLTMDRFIKVQCEEMRHRADVLVPMWRRVARDAQADSQRRIVASEGQARWAIMLAYRLQATEMDEHKGRFIDIVAKESETRRMRLQAYANKMRAHDRSEQMQALFKEEAAARTRLRALGLFDPERFLQLQVVAFSSLEAVKKQERRHFAAILSVVGIEEVIGLRQHADGHRQTTQQRWRLVDTEAQVRQIFVQEEATVRFFFTEMFARLDRYADEEFERQEWWYLYRDTSVLMWREQELQQAVFQHAPPPPQAPAASQPQSARPYPYPPPSPSSAMDHASWSPRPTPSALGSVVAPSPPAARNAAGNAVDGVFMRRASAELLRRHAPTGQQQQPLSSSVVVGSTTPLHGRASAQTGFTSPRASAAGGRSSALYHGAMPSPPTFHSHVGNNNNNNGSSLMNFSGSGVGARSLDTSTTTYMTHLLTKFDSSYYDTLTRSASARQHHQHSRLSQRPTPQPVASTVDAEPQAAGYPGGADPHASSMFPSIHRVTPPQSTTMSDNRGSATW